MQLRIFTEPQQGARYDDLLRVAKATEELGFDAFFRSDHYARIGAGDGRPGSTDAWTTLAGLARETSRIRLGTLVSPATFRPPGPLAIIVAQVDDMSGGRLDFGFGTGWFESEHVAYGLPFPGVSERFDRFAEQLEIIDGLWRTPIGETFDYAGRYYTLTNSPALPKPAQQPRPPIILGGGGRRRSAELAARFADEYNVAFRSVSETAETLARVRTAVQRPIVSSAAQTVCVGTDDAQLRARADAIGFNPADVVADALGGTPTQVVDKLGRFAEGGVSRMYLQTLDLRDFDHLELIASEVMPQVADL